MGIARAGLPGLLVFLLALSLAGAAPRAVRAFDRSAEEAAVRDLFERGLQGAFRSLDVERVLGHYADSALVITHTIGRGDKSRFRKSLVADFSRLREVAESSWKVEDIAFENEVARATVLITETVVDTSGRPLSRGSTFHYRLMKYDGSWRIVMQSYRPDFGVAEPGGHGGGNPRPLHPPR